MTASRLACGERAAISALRGFAVVIFLSALLLVLSRPAEAQITFRAASSSGNPQTITFVAADMQVVSTTSGGSLTPAIPAGAQADDLAIVFLAGRPTDTTEPGTSAGWTKRSSSLREVGTNDLKIITYWKVLVGGDTNPSFTVPASWSGSAGGMSAAIGVWRGVDTTTPFDVADVTGSSAAVDQWSPPSITTVTAGAWVVSAVATSDNNALAILAAQAQGFTGRMTGASYDDTTGGDHALGVADKNQPTAGAVTMLTWDITVNGTDPWAGITFALRPATGALTIPKPAGTIQNDVMIASIAVRPNTVTVTPPAGWTLVRRMDNANANANSLAVYRKVAGASEPASYTWTIGAGHNGATGGIQTFVGVDPSTPIDVENGQNTPVAPDGNTIHKTPSVTTTVANTMLVTSYGISNPGGDHWTAISTMTEAFDAGGGNQAVAGYYVLQAAAGVTGAKQANSAGGDVGNAHILALRPYPCTAVPDATYVAAAAPSGTGSVTVYWDSANPVLILRKTTPFAGEAPINGTAYVAGASIGAATVAYDGSASIAGVTCTGTTCTNTGLTNLTTYYYKVFVRSGLCYAAGTGAEVNATPQAGPHPAWSYTLAGGPMLKSGIAGDGTVHTTSNAGRIVSLNTADGTQTWVPVATNAPVQSWLTWVPIAGGIKTVQSGTATMTTQASLSVPITAVTLARSILFFSVQEDNLDPSNGNVRGQLTSSTNIQFNRTGTATTITIKWYVAEFVSGVSVQRGSIPITVNPMNVAISPVNLGKTFVLTSWQKPGATYGADDFLRARLTSSSNLELSHVSGALDGTADWQVVTMANASVQSGNLSFLSTDASLTATVASVDTTKSFLLASWDSTGDGIGANFVRGRITSPTQLTFDRGASGTALNLTWSLVTLNDGSTVRSGTASFASTATQVDVPLAPVTLTRSVAFLSGLQRGGSTPYAGASPNDNPGVGWFTADLTSATNLRLTRAVTGSATADAAWFVVDFAPGAATATVIGGDQSGRVYAVDVGTGTTTWAVDLSGSGADFIQATSAAQLRSYANAAFQATYADDLIFAGSRNAGDTNCGVGTSATNNKLFALRATDGAVLWTFNGTCTNAVDWIVGMPYVDYGRNRLYVTSRAGAAGTQTSLWVIDTLTGALVTPPSPLTLGHLEASPTLSADGSTIYVGNLAGTLYAVDATTLAVKWSLSVGAAVKGFLWEEYSVPGRLYFSTGSDVRCVQDLGAAGSACAGWTVSPVAGASTLLLLDKIYVGSSDGKVHQIIPTGVNAGVDEKQFPTATTLDGTQVGDVSTETGGELFVGTAAGKLYKIPLPLP